MLLRVLVQSPKGQYNTAVIKPPLKEQYDITVLINQKTVQSYSYHITR